MASIVDNAIRAGLGAVKSAAGADVTYHTASDASVAVRAVVLRLRVEAAGADGFTVHTEHRQYGIDAADLAIAGVAITPDVGHWIIHAGRRYDVHPEQPGEKPWRWSDRQFIRYRIDTREVSNA